MTEDNSDISSCTESQAEENQEAIKKIDSGAPGGVIGAGNDEKDDEDKELATLLRKILHK